ncbi:hypothetical protein BIU82_13800 [Arthrobacter sp. SW1]|nr:hypothetical protein BIU82_13800 [Arthrobacter sp. SW1]
MADLDSASNKVDGAGGHFLIPPFEGFGKTRAAVAIDNGGATFGMRESSEGLDRVRGPGTMQWNELHARDYQSARNFYAELFGFSYTEIGHGTEFVNSTIERASDGRTVGGITYEDTIPDEGPAYWLPWFQVRDPAITAEHATSWGARQVLPATDSALGRIAILRGPQGESFGVFNRSLGQKYDDGI